MGIQINGVLDVRWPSLLDQRSGKLVGSACVPYDDTTEALSTIPDTRRVEGLIVFVRDPGDATRLKWYQFQGGIEDDNLIDVTPGAGGGSTPTLQEVLTAGATLTAANTIAAGANMQTVSGSSSGTNPVLKLQNTGNGRGLQIDAAASTDMAIFTNGKVFGSDVKGSRVLGFSTSNEAAYFNKYKSAGDSTPQTIAIFEYESDNAINGNGVDMLINAPLLSGGETIIVTIGKIRGSVTDVITNYARTEIFSHAKRIVITSIGDFVLPDIRTFADDAAASADPNLEENAVYRVTGSKMLHIK